MSRKNNLHTFGLVLAFAGFLLFIVYLIQQKSLDRLLDSYGGIGIFLFLLGMLMIRFFSKRKEE